MGNAGTRPKTRAETKEETRRALLRAGLEEFVDRGLEAPSLDEICARAGYTRGAFYVHFKDREDFFVSVLNWVLNEILDSIVGTEAADEPMEASLERYLRGVSTGHMRVGETKIPMHRIVDACVRFPVVRENLAGVTAAMIDRMTRRMQRSQSDGTLRDDLEPTAVSMLISVVGFGAMLYEVAGQPVNPEGLTRTLLQMLEPKPGSPPA